MKFKTTFSKTKAVSVGVALTVAGCGDSSNSNGLQAGIFTDSPVAGIHYQTATQSGLTDTGGRFHYRRGETVSFRLGGIELGTAPGASEITPLDLVGADSIDDAEARGVKTRLVNILLLLQSLDRDHNPGNGIDLSGLDAALAAEVLDLSLPLPQLYSAGLQRIINQQAGFLQTPREAQNHFMETQGLSVTLELPGVDLFDDDGDGTADRKISYSYNSDGSLALISYTDESPPRLRSTAALTYDANGYPARLEYSDALSPQSSYLELFAYDAAGRLLQTSKLDSNGETAVERTNVYDATGNLISSSSARAASNYEALPLQTFVNFSAAEPRIDMTDMAFSAFDYAPATLPADIRPVLNPFLLIDTIAIDAGSGAYVARYRTVLNDTAYTYDAEGALTGKTVDIRYIRSENGAAITPLPQDFQAVEVYQHGLLQSRTTSRGATTTEDRFDYADNGSLVRCERRQTNRPARERSYEQGPGEVIHMGSNCNSVRRVLVTRDDSRQITGLESEWVRLDGPHPGGARQTQAFDYQQGRVIAYRQIFSGQTDIEWVYRYEYSDTGLLRRREVSRTDQPLQIRTREFTRLTVEALR